MPFHEPLTPSITVATGLATILKGFCLIVYAVDETSE